MRDVLRLAAASTRHAFADTPYARRFIVWRHHPDALRRPSTHGDTPTTSQALTWNLFRTLELLPPPFWLRRLNAALGVTPMRPAPRSATVQLWTSLSLPPGLDPRLRASAGVDVLIETESAVWALQVCDAMDVAPAAADGVTDPLTVLACAASWHARRRACYVGVIAADTAAVPIAAATIERYRLSMASFQLRLPARSHDAGNVAGFGLASWRQLMGILQDATGASAIERVEQSLASRSLRWCYDVLPAR